MRLGLAMLAASGCASQPVLMHQAGPPEVDSQTARIVFVHHSGPRAAICAPGEACAMAPLGWHYVGSPTLRIVDEAGTFLGDSYAGTSFATDLAPGAHLIVGWIGDDREPIALRAAVEAGHTYYVEVRGATIRSASSCGHGSCGATESTAWFHPLHSSDHVAQSRITNDTGWIAPNRVRASAVLGGDPSVRARIIAAEPLEAWHLEPDDGY